MFRIRRYFNFMSVRKQALIFSAVLVISSLILLAVRGLNWGIDFAGGMLFQMEFKKPVKIEEVRSIMNEFGLGQSIIQKYSDNGVIVRTKLLNDEQRKSLLKEIKNKIGDFNLVRFEKVGPVVGSQLRKEALIAVILALIGILIYITFRFQFRFAVASVLALIHDSIIVLGVFSLLYREISLPFVAAILTVVGYSLNDTIVVLDRVRENWRSLPKAGIVKLVNDSINQTLSRTINTSLTTFLPVLTLFLFGGTVISNFALALLIGIVVGTYSSIYIASAVIVEWELKSPAKR